MSKSLSTDDLNGKDNGELELFGTFCFGIAMILCMLQAIFAHNLFYTIPAFFISIPIGILYAAYTTKSGHHIWEINY